MKFITQLKQIVKYSIMATAVSTLLMQVAIASNVFNANNLYSQLNFEQARIAYLEATKVGSPHAYYQLGTIYYKGQGIKPDFLSSLIWFSLAAEYQYNDSENIVAQLMESIDPEQRPEVQKLVDNFKAKHGKKIITQKYLPEIITPELHNKIKFISYEEEQSIVESFNDFDGSQLDDDVLLALLDENNTEITADDLPTVKNPRNLPYFSVVDYDIAADGSIRNVTELHSIGRQANIDTAIYNLSMNNIKPPIFNNKPTGFMKRGYLGVAKYSRATMRNKHKDLYNSIKRITKKLAQSKSANDRYKHTMALLYFTWAPQKKGMAIKMLKTLAEEGHVNAQYEYGLYLYREQLNLKEAIKWLSLASQFGLSKAEYRLAKILQDSPWVVNDERKSLFWYESAAQQNHPTATLKAAELRLLAKDKSLHDQEAAVNYLKSIESIQSDNPEYNYLVAISHLKGEYRDFKKVVNHLRLAIARGKKLNWDVSLWEEQLDRWTTGNVYIKD
ncbi:SEL1-like repeat protein [Pseudocolwellia sp. AS88]|uniref:tetratricopeptide repeat protein n=1 Tax=Pseudocolwellia sp. AS88 TaxID=3063958 RepID=UPI0026F2B336|nr:SEL1-like repeat protein [Pseudocolwellia sp. AS88]MDO7085543.1 SEL1-like repeat protein [Pseudocolwellia sp. AS88]